MKPFLVDPDNAAFIEGRERELPEAGPRSTLRFVLGFVVLGLAVSFFAARGAWPLILLKLESAETEGVVTALTQQPKHRSVRYSYLGREKEETLTQWGHAGLVVGGPIRVFYHPADPSAALSEHANERNWWMLPGMLAFAGIWTFVPCVLAASAFSELKLRRRLSRQGRRVTGTIVSAALEKGKGGRSTLTVEYQAGPHRGRWALFRDDLSAGAVPPPGTPVVVLVADDGSHMVV